MMNVAAHPDDEDGATMTYYRNARNAIVYSVIFTRGEGGQNEIGPELYEELGVIRTDETERASRILGTQVLFLNHKDFGYSRFAWESFERWGGRDSVVANLVYLLRKLKPDVLFTNHDTVTVGPRRQHGHHQAAGIATYEAMGLSADPTYRPGQLLEEGIDLWQPRRLFVRNRGGGDSVETVTIPIGDIHAPSQKSYSEIAGEALFEHASQGMDMFAGRFRGRTTTSFRLYRSATDVPLSPDDLVGNLPPNAQANPDLTYWIDSGRLPAAPENLFKLDDEVVVPGQSIRLSWDTNTFSDNRLECRFTGPIDTTIVLSDGTTGDTKLRIASDAIPTTPKHIYQYNRIESTPPVSFAIYRTGSNEIVAAGYLPLEIAPRLMLDIPDELVRLFPGPNTVPFNASIFDRTTTGLELEVSILDASEFSTVLSDRWTFSVIPESDFSDEVSFTLPEYLEAGDYYVSVSGHPSPAATDFESKEIQVPARVFDVNVPADLRVGVIESYDNALDRALSELNVAHVLLDSLDLAQSRFDGLHTIVIDIRAYLVRSDLRWYNRHLLDWVEDGGHLIVNYHKTFEWNSGGADGGEGTLAPYPLQLGRGRVTFENAPVQVLSPDHVLFHQPNVIIDEDWNGWVQERGLYFPGTYDDKYVELFSMHDPGEESMTSSTLLAHYGEGTYLYTALVWYRQLKVFHPGAYKMFANMVSLPLVDGRNRQ